MKDIALFDEEELIPWKREWKNMPEFSHEDLTAKYQVMMSFATAQDVLDFAERLGISLKPSNGRQVQSRWFPDAEIGHMVNKRYRAKD